MQEYIEIKVIEVKPDGSIENKGAHEMLAVPRRGDFVDLGSKEDSFHQVIAVFIGSGGNQVDVYVGKREEGKILKEILKKEREKLEKLEREKTITTTSFL